MNAPTSRRRRGLQAVLALVFLSVALPLSSARVKTEGLKQGGKLRKEGTLDQAYCTYLVTSAMGKCTGYEVGELVYVERDGDQPCAETLYAAKGINNLTSACGLILELQAQTTPELGNAGRALGGAWITF